MALVKIQKNGKTLEVSKSAFKNFYENSGWEEVGEMPTSSNNQKAQEEDLDKNTINNKAKEDNVLPESPSESSDADWDEVMNEEDEDVQKPISEMNRNELIKFAADNDISLVGLTKNAQFREAIINALKERGE